MSLHNSLFFPIAISLSAKIGECECISIDHNEFLHQVEDLPAFINEYN